MAVFFRLAKHVRHLPLDGVEPLGECRDGRLRRRRFTGDAGRVGRAAPRKDLALDLLDLALEPLNALLGSRHLALGHRRGRNKRDACRCNQQAELTD